MISRPNRAVGATAVGDPSEGRALIGTAAAARILGMPEWMVRDRAKVGLIPCHRRREGGKLLFLRAELEQMATPTHPVNQNEVVAELREIKVLLREILNRLPRFVQEP
jgi:hypothetical protein